MASSPHRARRETSKWIPLGGFRCVVCAQVFSSLDELQAHAFKMHNERIHLDSPSKGGRRSKNRSDRGRDEQDVG
jgi:hypothetical protein